jgi:PQQ-dependent dehydrogenase (methanol/ethanol family)
MKVVFCMAIAAAQALAQQQVFVARCASCHGEEGRGTAQGPGVAMNPRVAARTLDDLASYIARGNAGAGMPSFSDLKPEELTGLARHLKRLNVETISGPLTTPRKLTWSDPKPGDWLTYNGSYSANRYSELREITRENVSGLKLKWVFPMGHYGLETTPLASEGVLYVTGQNQVLALDAATGSAIWEYSRPQSRGLTGDSRLGTNRGVAIRGDRVFFVTDNAHLLGLDRATGQLVWETVMPENVQQPYGGTVAPLVVGDLVIAGVAGGDHGIRGFIAAYRAGTGALAWRRWTVPAKGEPGIETWQGEEPVGGGGSSWLTGSYDPTTDTLYWPTGNPWPDSDDRDRPGDNLYTNCVLALNAKTGELKWHYQFTPHDLKDRDATEPVVLVDREFGGRPRKLLLHADRNGFFYVLDREDGKVLRAQPFLRRVDWASGVGSDGKPVVKDARGCPSDAANWDSTAYSPRTGFYYVLALEECTGRPTGYPDQTGQRFLRALKVDTGEIAWEVAQPGPARAKTWSGVLATAGGVVFYGQPNGGFAAVDERDGKELWRFPTNARMKASPMTFTFGGKQYVAVAAGPNILCFGL